MPPGFLEYLGGKRGPGDHVDDSDEQYPRGQLGHQVLPAKQDINQDAELEDDIGGGQCEGKVDSADAPFLKMLCAIETAPKVHEELAAPSAAAFALLETLRRPRKLAILSLSINMSTAAVTNTPKRIDQSAF